MDEGVTRSIGMANTFLDRFEALSPDARTKVQTASFGSHKHTGAMMMIADELTALRGKPDGDRLASFLVEAEQRIAGMRLPSALESLAKTAVRALAVQHLPSCSTATRDLYAPFEAAFPMSSLSG
jgi:hypothetical protein